MIRRNAAEAAALEQRLTAHARRWPEITEIKVRRRAGYAYVDAVVPGGGAGVLQLCRLRRTAGPDLWRFEMFAYSSGQYVENLLPTGLPFGTPEDALDCAYGLCLSDERAG